MCIHRFATILASCCLLACFCATAGCTAGQRQRFCQALGDPNNPGTKLTDAVEGPDGASLPLPLRIIMEALGCTMAVGYAVQQQMKRSNLVNAMRPVIRGVEESPGDVVSQVKAEIERQMVKAGNYVKANALVDELKGA